jgi:hypothetical protein
MLIGTTQLTLVMGAAFLCFLAGCSKTARIKPLSGGYEEVLEWSEIPDMMAHARTHGTEGQDRSFGRYLHEASQTRNAR